jgi:hypothetical protein
MNTMPMRNFGSVSPDRADVVEARSLQPARVVSAMADEADKLSQPDHDQFASQDQFASEEQFASDVAAIEHATAALRKADPALESGTAPATETPPKSRPVWLIVGVLWLSTALVTAGAVVAISRLVG